MLRFFLINLLYLQFIFAYDDYHIIKSDRYTLIYTDEYIQEVQFLQKNLNSLLRFRDKSYAYTMDEPVRIILVSNNLQIPNAFSTQIPFNLGMYYNGGSGKNDYFAIKSWLKTLLLHELSHNYQLNAKKSKVSQGMHTYLGNNYMPLFAYIFPFFTLPNLTLPTVFLEGNAVLNESLYDNGGRLYSGEHNSLKNTLVLSEKLTLARFINDHQIFPYTNEKYIVGGYFMEYLALKYGVDRVNSFFYTHSSHYMNPFLINNSFRRTFGKNLSTLFHEFISYTKKKYKNFKLLKSNRLALSKSAIYLSKIEDKIFFLSSDLKTKKELYTYDAKHLTFTHKSSDLENGKIFKIKNKFYTSMSTQLDYSHYKFGLVDENNEVLSKSLGKDIQDIYNDKLAYIDIKTSFLESKLFINDQYIDTIASSALFDTDANIYYFKQRDNKRVLYKNKTPLFSYDGYYGKIVEVSKDHVYFISNSNMGSSLYSFHIQNNKILKLSSFDNIIDAKLINDTSALVVCHNWDGYGIYKIDLENIEVQNIPKASVSKLQNNFVFNEDYKNEILRSKEYSTLLNMEFSALSPYFSYTSEDRNLYGLNASFYDPLLDNGLMLYFNHLSDASYYGITYMNKKYFPINFNLYHKDAIDKNENSKSLGGKISFMYPFIYNKQTNLDIGLNQYFDTDYKKKNPQEILLQYMYQKSFPLAHDYHLFHGLDLLINKDRGDTNFAFKYKFIQHLFLETYLHIKYERLYSNTQNLSDARGIKIVNDQIESLNTELNTIIEGLDFNTFVKEVEHYSLGLNKTFHFSGYGYKIPFGITSETIYYQYNHFNLLQGNEIQMDEHISGVQLDLLLGHKFMLPLDIKYIYNENVLNKKKIKISFGLAF